LEQVCDLPRGRFGFTGGADDLSINYATTLGVDWFLRLQPFLWDDVLESKTDPFFEASRIEHRCGHSLYFCAELAQFRLLPLRRAIADGRRLALHLDIQARELLDAARAARAAIWPVYGLQHFNARAGVILPLLIAAANRFRAKTGRTVVIMSFSP